MTQISSIETYYAGCRFRSRLEARWAVLFDRLGISWEYEPQGYVVAGKPYLPDFYRPTLNSWVEVKGSTDNLDLDLLRQFVTSSKAALLLAGPMPEPYLGGEVCWNLLDPEPLDDPDGFDEHGQPVWTSDVAWTVRVKPVSFLVWATQRRLWTHYPDVSTEWNPDDPTRPFIDWDYQASCDAAYDAARAARFEYGERP